MQTVHIPIMLLTAAVVPALVAAFCRRLNWSLTGLHFMHSGQKFVTHMEGQAGATAMNRAQG